MALIVSRLNDGLKVRDSDCLEATLDELLRGLGMVDFAIYQAQGDTWGKVPEYLHGSRRSLLRVLKLRHPGEGNWAYWRPEGEERGDA